jgi:hypothetical protein
MFKVDSPDAANAFKIGTYLLEKPRVKLFEINPEIKKPVPSPAKENRFSLLSFFRLRK